MCHRQVDGDELTYRTLPGTEPPLAGYFTRGSGHYQNVRYTVSGEVYARKLDRLARKFETIREALPDPVVDGEKSKLGIVAFGSTFNAIQEARERLREAGLEVDFLRVRALPLNQKVTKFVGGHERVYVIEMNRDGQLYDLLRLHLPAELVGRLTSIRRYDGQPIPADAITRPILELEAVPAT